LGPLTGCWISQGALRDLGLAPSPLGGLGPAGLNRAGNKRTSDDCEGSRESRAEIQTAAVYPAYLENARRLEINIFVSFVTRLGQTRMLQCLDGSMPPWARGAGWALHSPAEAPGLCRAAASSQGAQQQQQRCHVSQVNSHSVGQGKVLGGVAAVRVGAGAPAGRFGRRRPEWRTAAAPGEWPAVVRVGRSPGCSPRGLAVVSGLAGLR